MSLADELLADFEEVTQELDNEVSENTEKRNVNGSGGSFTRTEEQHSKKSVRNIALLLDSEGLKNVLEKINSSNISNTRSNETFYGPVEQDPEYEVIVQANNLLADIDTELSVVHKYLRDIYSKRFPELESLVTSPYEYIHTVHYLGNVTEALHLEGIDFLPPAIKMVVSVTASTTLGEKLSDEDMSFVNEACQMAFDLGGAKMKILEYVQSRMTFIAPNLSKIVGANTAAEIMGAAGGLTALIHMPACNILLLGSTKRNLAGFSSTSVLPHTGFVYYSPIVQKLPPFLRKKAARTVSSKITLAARVDSKHEFPDGSYGDRMLVKIQAKYDKWLQPPPVKEVKALPRPDDQPRKKRGGRRQRRIKQKYALTELRRQANRVNFGLIQEDVYQTAIGFGLNAVGQPGSGKVRNAAMDTKTKISISKRLQRNLASMNSVYGTRTMIRSNVPGTASSVAFTPMQGIEIINPNIAADAKNPPNKDNTKYFSNQSAFLAKKVSDP